MVRQHFNWHDTSPVSWMLTVVIPAFSLSLLITRRLFLVALNAMLTTLLALANVQRRSALDHTHHDDPDTSAGTLRALFHKVADAIHLWEIIEERPASQSHVARVGRCLEVNEAACQLTGYSRAEFLAMAPDEVQTILLGQPADLITAEMLAMGTFTIQATTTTKDNRRIPVEVSVHLFESEGRWMALSLGRNITARKQAENELRDHHDHLEHLVEERTATLRAANEDLHRLGRIKDEFVSNVSHELRTPIANIKLYHDLLTRRPDQRERYLVTLQHETARLERLIESLLTLSRFDQQRMQPILVPLDLNALLGSLVQDRELLANEQNLDLHFLPIPDLPMIYGDVGLVTQAASILLTNALNYTPPGGTITVRTQCWGNWTGFTICDTGPGIPAEEQERIFERFFRGYSADLTGLPGTGLGLSIAREIMACHRGHIKVESPLKSGCGTAFHVQFPMQ